MTDAPSSMQQLGVLLSGGVASFKPSISFVAPTPPPFVLVQSDTVADAWSLMSPFFKRGRSWARLQAREVGARAGRRSRRAKQG